MPDPTPLAALREALAKATPGPWEIVQSNEGTGDWWLDIWGGSGSVAQLALDARPDRWPPPRMLDDARLICLLRNHADALLAVVEAGRNISRTPTRDPDGFCIYCHVAPGKPHNPACVMLVLRTALSALDGEGW